MVLQHQDTNHYFYDLNTLSAKCQDTSYMPVKLCQGYSATILFISNSLL